jgi:hypothetical protein
MHSFRKEEGMTSPFGATKGGASKWRSQLQPAVSIQPGPSSWWAIGPESGKRERHSTFRTWEDIAATMGVSDPYNLNPRMIRNTGGIFITAEYRSTVHYIEQAKLRSVEQGHAWTQPAQLARDKVKRAANRGLGAARATAPYPVSKLNSLPSQVAPRCEGGPVWPKRVDVAGCWRACNWAFLSSAWANVAQDIPSDVTLGARAWCPKCASCYSEGFREDLPEHSSSSDSRPLALPVQPDARPGAGWIGFAQSEQVGICALGTCLRLVSRTKVQVKAVCRALSLTFLSYLRAFNLAKQQRRGRKW